MWHPGKPVKKVLQGEKEEAPCLMLLVGTTCRVKTEKWPLGFTVWWGGKGVGSWVGCSLFTEKSFLQNI